VRDRGGAHWEVASEPAIKLITTVDRLNGNPKIGRAQALQRSMLSMIPAGKD
jgi:hypothetical protein